MRETNKNKTMATRIENPFTLEQYIEDRGIIEFVRWYESGVLSLAPEFQRNYKWSKKQASELIESFLLGLPVPNIFLYKENNKRTVIDGVQRLTSIIRFFQNKWYSKDKKTGKIIETEFELDFRDDEKKDMEYEYKWQGKTINTLSSDDKIRLENFSQLRVTTIKQEDPNDNTSIYYLFERLNSGGTQLTSMEVRNSIYRGALMNKLKELSKNETFKKLVRKNKDDKNDETIYEEVLLRIFAFYDNFKTYSKDITLVKFLNDYCKQNRNPSEDWISTRETLFKNALKNNDFIALIKKILKTKNNGILETLFVLFFQYTFNFNLDETKIDKCLNDLPKSATYSDINLKKRFQVLENLIVKK